MTGNPLQIIQWLYNFDKDKQFDIKEHKEKRSLDQNAYCWKLLNEVANKLRKPKEEVYFDMLKSYGQVSEISMLSSINPVGYLKYYEVVSKRIFNGNEFTIYRIYKGSSEFDTREMSIFIDGIVQEAQQLGIETLTPEEIIKLEIMQK